MGVFKTIISGYKIMFKEINLKHNDLIPKVFSGCGTGLMMIGSAVMAKTAMKEDVQQVIAEANAVIDEAKTVREGEKKSERTKRIFKAKAAKGLKIVKVFHKGIIYDAVGFGMNAVGFGMQTHGKHTALKACGAIGASFASYRAAVRDDLGEEADIRYMSGKHAVKRTEKIDKKTGEVTQDLEYIQDDDGLTINKDPNAFRFWFSKETCPGLWSANYDLRRQNLVCVEDTLTRMLWKNNHLTLNDMRREFGGLQPAKMDVGIGGIYGRILKPNIPLVEQRVNLHFLDDVDFREGRTDSCWIIFDCDPEPIVNKIGKKFKPVEE